MPEAPKKYGVTRVTSELSRKAAARNGQDWLAIEEGMALADLVSKVHQDGRIGTSYPVVTREPMRWQDDGLGGRNLVEADADTVTDWYIRATVYTVPR